MWTTIWTLTVTLWLLGHALCAGDSTPESLSYVGDAARLARSLQVVLIQQTILTVAENTTPPKPDTPRHMTEKEHLLQRMDKKNGRWTEHHPRHRLLEALRGFSAYAQTHLAELDHLKTLYSHVSKQQKALLEKEVGYSKKFTSISDLVAINQNLCHTIVQNALEFYRISQGELDRHTEEMMAAGRAAERVSVSQSLKHLVRDWAAEGANERDVAFSCIIKVLEGLVAGHDEPLTALLPGAGLGRLGQDVSKLGFDVTNNEWSMYQNVVYRFLETNGGRRHQNVVYPFLDSWSHHKTTSDMLRGVSFPDVAMNASAVVLVEGDFTTAFMGEAGHFDVVVTHFFIDTARNLMSYLDTIFRILKPGGHWINFGPLLYGSAPFVQLSLDEIVAVAEAMGFQFRDGPDECGAVSLAGMEVRSLEAVYGFDERALVKNAYDAQFWVAQKP
ncbi:N2227-like protein-domain-containing protein [Immersiella caudata]|uniref:N2227-like protein-domain-containing protein n=1 Tax=Immersiella caudata TaxID=314043 RepID=A0AA39WDU7_9PEZI|nr:N2227-like protein-domain-containing protein [Immersiella caudata]